jgi:hypothetical protein
VSDYENEPQQDDTADVFDEDLQEAQAQEEKSHGEDEGEREESLDEQ